MALCPFALAPAQPFTRLGRVLFTLDNILNRVYNQF